MKKSLTPSPAALGALLAIATIPLHFCLSKTQSQQFAAMLLAAIGAIYVGFGLQTGSLRQISVELIVASGFLAAALVGLWLSPWAIPAVFVLHGFWDYAHREKSGLAPIPRWYPSFCAIYDWVAGVALVLVWGLRT